MNNLVSVILPTYKRSEKIERAINSILNQTYQNFEIIIVDDNDPGTEYRKETEQYMKKYKDNPKVRYIRMKKNGGGAAARNYGIKNAKGSYITFLDDDDEYKPDKLEKQLTFMLKNHLDASFSNEVVLDENGNLRYIKDYKNFKKEDILRYHLTEMIVGPQTFMYKKEVLDAINGFDIVPAGQEYILMYKTIMAGYNVDYLNENLVNIYIHQGARISTSNKKLIGEKKLYELKRKHFAILNFKQRQRVRYEWYVNCYRFYKSRSFLKKIYYSFILAILFPIQTIKTLLKKIKKRLTLNKKNKKKKVMFISSVGGHLTQLLELKSIFNNYNYILITEKNDVTKKLKAKYKISYLPYGSRNQKLTYPFILFYSCLKSVFYFLKYRPEVIITTGANTAAAMCCLGKIFHRKVIFIESFAKRNTPTITGRYIYKLHAYTTFVVQWESMKEVYPDAKYWGGIY